MYLLIIFAIIGGFISFKVANQGNPFNWGIFIGGLFKTAFVYLIVLGIGRGIYAKNNDLNYKRYVDLPIASLANKDGWSISGGFILGTGGVSGGSYTYYVTYGKFRQGLKRMELYYNSYYIDESSRKRPCIEKYWYVSGKKAYESKWWWNRKASEEKYMHENYGDKTIVVPPGTVFKHFDLKD